MRNEDKMVTFSVDAPAGTVQVIAAEVLGSQPNVTQGAWTELTLPRSEAQLVWGELRRRGYVVAE